MKVSFSRKKDAHKAMCWNIIQENNRRYERMKKKKKEAVSKARKEKAKEAHTE